MRIVSLAPHATELLEALGLGDQVTAMAPDALDAHELRELEPQLVFTPESAFERVRAILAGLPGADVVRLDPRTFGETLADARTIAERTGTGAAAIELIKASRARVDALRRTLRD
ncbi:MAG TPA: hypothetical protein VHB30_15090, partial [Solirubrobacteraceae bacterium]|nr:hypothetical protein [Solirubrobacteraceae bacterium]